MTNENRQPSGTPIGGQFAASVKAAPAGVALADSDPNLPDFVPDEPRRAALRLAAADANDKADQIRRAAAELELATGCADLYEEHRITGFSVEWFVDVDGEYLTTTSFDTDDGVTHTDDDDDFYEGGAEAINEMVFDYGIPDHLLDEEKKATVDTVELIAKTDELAGRLADARKDR